MKKKSNGPRKGVGGIDWSGREELREWVKDMSPRGGMTRFIMRCLRHCRDKKVFDADQRDYF